MNHFPIWHLANASFNPIKLYKSNDSEYIVTQDGEWTPIIACGLFVIINQSLLSFFERHLDVPIPSHIVSIYDRVLNRYFEGYHRIYIENRITPDMLDSVTHTGMKIWCHEDSGGIFISPGMKRALEGSNIKGVEIHPGFSRFGGTYDKPM